MYAVLIDLVARDGGAADVRALFAEFIPLALAEPGVRDFKLFADRDDPARFVLYELYDDRAALEAHRKSPLFAVWRPRIAALESSRTLREFDVVT